LADDEPGTGATIETCGGVRSALLPASVIVR
jgi:hypothetical protein